MLFHNPSSACYKEQYKTIYLQHNPSGHLAAAAACAAFVTGWR